MKKGETEIGKEREIHTHLIIKMQKRKGRKIKGEEIYIEKERETYREHVIWRQICRETNRIRYET